MKFKFFTSIWHFFFGCFFNYSWLVLLVVPISSCWWLIIQISLLIVHNSRFSKPKYSLFIFHLIPLFMQYSLLSFQPRFKHLLYTVPSGPSVVDHSSNDCRTLSSCAHACTYCSTFSTISIRWSMVWRHSIVWVISTGSSVHSIRATSSAIATYSELYSKLWLTFVSESLSKSRQKSWESFIMSSSSSCGLVSL